MRVGHLEPEDVVHLAVAVLVDDVDAVVRAR